MALRLNTRAMSLVVTPLITFLVGSQIMLPLPRRGLTGGGLYDFVDELRFYEVVALTTIVTISLSRVSRRPFVSTLAAVVGGACLNVALLIADIRSHSYPDFPERYIAETYGSPPVIWASAAALFCAAAVLLRTSHRFDRARQPVQAPTSNT